MVNFDNDIIQVIASPSFLCDKAGEKLWVSKHLHIRGKIKGADKYMNLGHGLLFLSWERNVRAVVLAVNFCQFILYCSTVTKSLLGIVFGYVSVVTL